MSRLRRLAAGLAVLCTLTMLGLLALRWVDAASVPIVVIQSALRVVGCAGALLLLLLALVARMRWVTALALTVSLVVGATFVAAAQRSTVQPSGHDITIVSANLEYGQGNPEDVLAQVRRLRADVIVLVEVTPAALARFEAAGLSAYPHQAGIPLPGAAGIVVRSRMPLMPIDWGPDYPQPWVGAVGRLTTEHGDVIIRGIHTHAPNLSEVGRWRDSMGELAQWAQQRHTSEPVVMAGDFNAGWDHPVFRQVADGFADASRATGQVWTRTWPQGRSFPPFTELDHVLVRRADVVDYGMFGVGDTDHVGVWSRVRIR